MRIYRLLPDGRKMPPAKDGSVYVLGDPRHGSEKHHARNAVRVSDIDEVIRLIRDEGHSIRIKTDSAPSLVRRNLYIDGVEVT